MKVIWQLDDIECGRIVGQIGRRERYMIGYDPACIGVHKYTLNSLADGMVMVGMTKEQLCNHLNKACEMPEELLK